MYNIQLPQLGWRLSWMWCHLTCMHSVQQFRQYWGSGAGTRVAGMVLVRDHLRGHLFWGDKILKGVELKGDCTDKREIKNLFYGRWKVRLTHLLTCCQTKFWLEDPGSLGDALAHLDRITLGLALQAMTGHNYLNYHHNIVGNISEQICQFCWEEHEEFICSLHVSALHSLGCAWTLSGGTSLIDSLLTYTDLSGSQKWTALARPR